MLLEVLEIAERKRVLMDFRYGRENGRLLDAPTYRAKTPDFALFDVQ